MCLLFVITLVAVVVGAPQDCTSYCQSLYPEAPWLPWCDCSSETLVKSVTPETASITDSSNYEESDIYYEPDDTQVKFNPKEFFKQPFLIKDPTSYLKLKTPKREADIKDTLVSIDQPPVETNSNIGIHERPLYLDIAVNNIVESRDADEVVGIRPTEKSLVECLDLHIVIFSRKGGDTSTILPNQVVNTGTLEKYAAMSDAEVILAIKTKCAHPLEIVNRSRQNIEEAQPKKKGIPSNTFNIPTTGMPIDSDLSLPTSRGKHSSSGVNSNMLDERYSDLEQTASEIQNSVVINETATCLTDLSSSNETDSASCAGENKIVSTRSTVGISNTGAFDADYTFRAIDTMKDHSHTINREVSSTDSTYISDPSNEKTDANIELEHSHNIYKENNSTDSLEVSSPSSERTNANVSLDHSLNMNQNITSTDTTVTTTTTSKTNDTSMVTDFNYTFTDQYKNNTDLHWPDVTVTEEVKKYHNKSQDGVTVYESTTTLVNTEGYLINGNDTTIEPDASTITLEPSVESTMTVDFVAENRNADDTDIHVTENIENNSVTSESATKFLPTQEELTSQLPDTTQDNIPMQNNFNFRKSDDKKIRIHHHHQLLRESEIMIPKILTKELANGSVISFVGGYEILPNSDFITNIDDSSHEDHSAAEDPQIYSRRSFDSPIKKQRGISGKFYFMFDQALIPARFLQRSDGVVTLGLNGNTMCKNFLENHRHRSPFLLKLCNAVMDDNKYGANENMETR